MQSQEPFYRSTSTTPPHTLSFLSRHPWILAGSAVLGLLAGLAVTVRTPPLYRSHVTFHAAGNELYEQAAAVQGGRYAELIERQVPVSGHELEAQDAFSRFLRFTHRGGEKGVAYSVLARDAAHRVSAEASDSAHALTVTCLAREAQLAHDACDVVTSAILQQAAPIVPAGEQEKANRLSLAAAGLQHHIDAWKQQLQGREPASADVPTAALPAGLETIRQAIVQGEIDRLKLEEGDADVVKIGDLQHRSDLLRLSYQGALDQMRPEARRAGEAALLQQEIDAGTTYAAELSQRVSANASATANKLSVSQPAAPPEYAGVPRRILAAGAGMAAGLLCGVALALYRDRHPRYLRAPGDIGRFLKVPELGVIPDASLSMDDAGAYREAALSLLAEDWGKGVRTYVVMSPDPGDGRTTVAAGLGVAFAGLKLRVALLDADLRNPQLHTQFQRENTAGLRNLLNGEMDAASAALESFLQATAHSGLWLLSAGAGEEPPSSLLHTVHWATLTERLRRDFDLVVIDSSSLFEADDVRRLASQGGAAVLVARAGRTRLTHLTAALRQHSLEGVRVTGALLNGSEGP